MNRSRAASRTRPRVARARSRRREKSGAPVGLTGRAMWLQYHSIDTVTLYLPYREERPVPVVQIEHPIRDFETWKAAFDRDPVQREASGVTSYRIYRPVDDPRYIAVDLE